MGKALPGVTRSYLVAALVPAVLTILALPVAAWIVGSKFAEALFLVPFLAGVQLVETFYFPNALVLFYAQRTRTIATITVTAGLLNVGLNALLTPLLGVPGALASRYLTGAARSGATWARGRQCLRDGTHGLPPIAPLP